jgi:Coenzyme PQQ synthesis protein D (PqqD)
MLPPGQSTPKEVRRSRNIVSRVVADEAIVVPIRRGAADMDSIYTFNETGTMLWAMIEQSRSAADMVRYLESEYGLSAEQAHADMKKFVAELNEAGLIEHD